MSELPGPNQDEIRKEEQEKRINEVVSEYGINKASARVFVETRDRIEEQTHDVPIEEGDEKRKTVQERRRGIALFDSLPKAPTITPGRLYEVRATIYQPDAQKMVGDTGVRELMRVSVVDVTEGEGLVVSQASVTASASELTDGVMVKTSDGIWAHPGKFSGHPRYINDQARRVITGDQKVYVDQLELKGELIEKYKGRRVKDKISDIRRQADNYGSIGQSEAAFVLKIIEPTGNNGQ